MYKITKLQIIMYVNTYSNSAMTGDSLLIIFFIRWLRWPSRLSLPFLRGIKAEIQFISPNNLDHGNTWFWLAYLSQSSPAEMRKFCYIVESVSQTQWGDVAHQESSAINHLRVYVFNILIGAADWMGFKFNLIRECRWMEEYYFTRYIFLCPSHSLAHSPGIDVIDMIHCLWHIHCHCTAMKTGELCPRRRLRAYLDFSKNRCNWGIKCGNEVPLNRLSQPTDQPIDWRMDALLAGRHTANQHKARAQPPR